METINQFHHDFDFKIKRIIKFYHTEARERLKSMVQYSKDWSEKDSKYYTSLIDACNSFKEGAMKINPNKHKSDFLYNEEVDNLNTEMAIDEEEGDSDALV